MSNKAELAFIISEDEDEGSPRVHLSIDRESDVRIQQEDAVALLSHAQAMALHRALGQLLVRHARSWGTPRPELHVVS